MRMIPADRDGVLRAAAVLRGGGTMVYPTDTVYGLGASVDHVDAILATFRIKCMDPAPQSLVMADHAMAARYVRFTGVMKKFLAHFPDGPFTLLVPIRESAIHLIPQVLVRDGIIGIRFPRHPFPIMVARAVGPITSTSANRHGEPPPNVINKVRLPGVELYVDGGPCPFGTSSTIIAQEGDRLMILREGVLGKDEIRHHMGDRVG